jgi:rubredoxin
LAPLRLCERIIITEDGCLNRKKCINARRLIIDLNLAHERYRRIRARDFIKPIADFDLAALSRITRTHLKRRIMMDKYVCAICGYVYDPEQGDPDNGVAAGTKWEDVPDDWECPVCGASKADFEKE